MLQIVRPLALEVDAGARRAQLRRQGEQARHDLGEHRADGRQAGGDGAGRQLEEGE